MAATTTSSKIDIPDGFVDIINAAQAQLKAARRTTGKAASSKTKASASKNMAPA